MQQEALELLEFSGLLEIIAGLTQSSGGCAYLCRMRPSNDEAEIQTRQARVREVIRLHQEGKSVSLLLDGDPTPVFEELRWEGRVLRPPDFLLLLSYLRAGQTLLSILRSSSCEILKATWAALPPLTHLLRAVTRTFEDEGEIRDQASPDLAEIRQRKRKARRRVQKHLEKLLTKHQKALIPDAFVTLRNHRYVIPARVEQQRAVAGVVHAASSSGATVFVEPFSAVEFNNECLLCDDLEREIIERILTQLSELFRQNLEGLLKLLELLSEFDALQGMARYSERNQCVLAELSKDGELSLREARHPLLLESLGADSVIPLSLQLPLEQRVLIISGPNTGGKTVALKTIGLLALAAHAGIPVPAREAVFPLLRQVQADIGDHQSIAENLSTFSAHILRIRRILRDLEIPSLVLLDEIGSGTDPIYGGALGVSIVDGFRRAGAILVVTTHLRAVKIYASDRPEVLNASVGLDPSSLRPTYELTVGRSGESSAFEIAAQLGLPQPLLEQARALLSDQEKLQESYLEELQLEKQCLAEERAQLRDLEEALRGDRIAQQSSFEAQRTQLEKEFEKRLKEAEDSYTRDVNQFLKSSVDRIEAARLRQQAAGRREVLRDRAREKIRTTGPAAPVDESSLKPGQEVFHRLFRKRGKVLEAKSNSALIEIDGKKVSAALSQLRRIEKRKVTRKPSRRVVVQVVEDTEPELNLVSQRVDEAMDLLDKFLDRAFLSELNEVRIIHGFGTGRLKNAVQDMLHQHPHVERFQLDGGATTVVLRT